jgi:hypothetical protein
VRIGSEILWQGRRHVLVGVDPTNVPERRAYLRDLDTEELFEVPFAELVDPDDACAPRGLR